MTQPSHPDKGVPQPDDARASSERHDTLLLSDVPNATQLLAEVAEPPTASAYPGAQDLSPLAPRYDILAEAGHGSMGDVYKARDRETGEIVALKILKREIASDQAMLDRFKNEVLFARKITHKNVCRVHEFNRLGGIAYTSMEYVEGDSLRSVLNRFGGLPLRKAFDLVLQVCSGLEEAHAQGIVHRDLKPENVMIDAQGNVKIMDFGIARSMEAMTRLTGSMVGTPAYMAPEQVAGKPVDYRTDIYALGLILYEVFTGKPAFQAENAVAVALKQMRESPAPPHEIEPSVPVFVERAILKCLEKEPPKRFHSVKELKGVLRTPGPAAAPAANVPVADSSRSTPLPQAPTSYAPPPVLTTARRGVSPLWWILLGAALVLGGLSAWPKVQKRIAQEQAKMVPPAPIAPAPPDSALNSAVAPSAAQPDAQPSATQPDSGDSSPAPASVAPAPAAPASAPQPDAPSRAAPAPSKATHSAASAETPAKSKPRRATPEPTPQEVARHSDKSYGESEPVAAPPVNDHTPSYLWVGRYEREDRAQNAAKKIEDLGLPVAVIPRHNGNGEFFVVFTGPFGPERVASVMSWLETQGFPNVRLVKNPIAGQGRASNQGSDSNP